ncbi:MAG: acylphosphatase [Candidatus Bathyarchaeota archaeon B63]|nr:MAG: acylphosphatase [Candidatus Bathyarchaeota archaeon B63]
MRVRAHVYVSGRVQGVFFRYETRRRALRLGVSGWVRNLPDGRVEALFEGEKEEVEEMIRFCWRGPPGAIVRDVEVHWEKPAGDLRGFHIRY